MSFMNSTASNTGLLWFEAFRRFLPVRRLSEFPMMRLLTELSNLWRMPADRHDQRIGVMPSLFIGYPSRRPRFQPPEFGGFR